MQDVIALRPGAGFILDEPFPESEDLDEIFEPGFTTKANGTGLGLPLATRIVLNHDGQVLARNVDTAGAEFSVHLPLVGVMHDGELTQGAAAVRYLAAQPA